MYVLHYYPDTASLAVRLVLADLRLPHELRMVDRDGGGLANPAYRALHPLGKIPVLETPDGPMFETAAILLYLADRHGGLAPSLGSPDRAAFLKWLFFTSTNLHAAEMELFYPERVAGPEAVPELLPRAAERLRVCLAALDHAAAVSPAWMPAGEPSLMGWYLGMLVRWLSTIPPGEPGRIESAEYPALHRVFAMLEARPAALEVAADEGLGATIFTNPAY